MRIGVSFRDDDSTAAGPSTGNRRRLAFRRLCRCAGSPPRNLRDCAAGENARAILNADLPHVAFLSLFCQQKGSTNHARCEKIREASATPLEPVGRAGIAGGCGAGIGGGEIPRRRVPVAGRANVLIFPDLDSGNIAYKLVERLGGVARHWVLSPGIGQAPRTISRADVPRGGLWNRRCTRINAVKEKVSVAKTNHGDTTTQPQVFVLSCSLVFIRRPLCVCVVPVFHGVCPGKNGTGNHREHLTEGRVVICATKDAIILASADAHGEGGSRPPAITALSAERMAVMLGAVEWVQPDSKDRTDSARH